VPVVSIITPIGPNIPAHYLEELFASLLIQEVDWEWLPQWDGLPGQLPEGAQKDPRVREGANGRQLYAAMSRNRALARAEGDLVRNLDADDLLSSGALASQIEILEQQTEAAFVCGAEQAYGQPDGIQTPRVPEGRIEINQLETYWRENESIAISHSTSMWRKQEIWRQGGWPAQSGMDDVGLTLMANIDSPGWASYQTVLIRRAHPGQITIDPSYIRDRATNKALIHAKLIGKRQALGLSIPSSWRNPPRDKNKQLAIAKGRQMGHQYPADI
jgi:hypothetical protein